MLNTVFVKEYPLPSVDREEWCRYAACKQTDGGIETLFEESLGLLPDKQVGRVCFRAFTAEECLSSVGEYAKSKLVQLRFQGAQYAIAFAATVGLGFDRLVARYASVSPTRGALLQALGAERIESLCELFQKEIKTACKKEGYVANERFSAGYGDFALQAQTWFFKELDCPRKIGVTLTDGYLMSPTKSVTGLIVCKYRA